MALAGSVDVTVASGQVTFAFTVRNAGTEAVSLQFVDGQRARVTVADESGTVWTWGEGRLFTQVVGTERLAPGESLTTEAVWERPIPGEYTATASLTATNVDLVAETSFVV